MCHSIRTSLCLSTLAVSAETVLYSLGNSGNSDVNLPLMFQYLWQMLSLATVWIIATHSFGAYLSLFSCSFVFDARTLWNDLPDEVRAYPTIGSFWQKIKAISLQKGIPTLVSKVPGRS